MAIRFQCPQGHLLQGDEAHMGMQTQCPYCGVMFVIPVADPRALLAVYAQQQPALHAPPPAAFLQPEGFLSQTAHDVDDSAAADSGLGSYLDQVATGEAAHESQMEHVQQPYVSQGVDRESPHVDDGESSDEDLLHIPCPNGHELETPYDMLGQEVLCPHCEVQFRLRHEDSFEHRAKVDKHFEERGKLWFNWAITAAVLIGGGLLALMLVALNK